MGKGVTRECHALILDGGAALAPSDSIVLPPDVVDEQPADVTDLYVRACAQACGIRVLAWMRMSAQCRCLRKPGQRGETAGYRGQTQTHVLLVESVVRTQRGLSLAQILVGSSPSNAGLKLSSRVQTPLRGTRLPAEQGWSGHALRRLRHSCSIETGSRLEYNGASSRHEPANRSSAMNNTSCMAI